MTQGIWDQAESLVAIDKLLPHEEINANNLKLLKKKIGDSQRITSALIIDRKSCLIIDGHHRYNLAKDFGFTLFPAFLIDYFDENLKVLENDISGAKMDKKLILEQALKGVLLPSKSTFHGYIDPSNGTIKHISTFFKQIDVCVNKLC